MAGEIYEVVLKGGGPWGFRLQGGKDFGQPLVMAKVFARDILVCSQGYCGLSCLSCRGRCFLALSHAFAPRSKSILRCVLQITPGGKAANCGVNQGDTILEIGNQHTEEMTHFDAQNAIRRAGQTLQLRVQR